MIDWLKPQPVEGTDIEVRPISVRRMGQLRAMWAAETAETEVVAQLAAWSAFKAGESTPLWTLEEARDQPWPLVERIGDIALQLNGMVGGDPVEAAKGN